MIKTHKPRGHFWTCPSAFQKSEEIRNVCFDDCTATEGEVLVADMDDKLPASQRLAKRQRVEQLVNDFLDGQALVIHSARPHPTQLKQAVEGEHRSRLAEPYIFPELDLPEDEEAIWADVDDLFHQATRSRSPLRSYRQRQTGRPQQRRFKRIGDETVVEEEQARCAFTSVRPVPRPSIATHASSGAVRQAAALDNRRVRKLNIINSAQIAECPASDSGIKNPSALSEKISTGAKKASNTEWSIRRQTRMFEFHGDESVNELSPSILRTPSKKTRITGENDQEDGLGRSASCRSSSPMRLHQRLSTGSQQKDCLFWNTEDIVAAEVVHCTVPDDIEIVAESLTLPVASVQEQGSRTKSPGALTSPTATLRVRRRSAPATSQVNQQKLDDIDIRSKVRTKVGPQERTYLTENDTPFTFRRLNSHVIARSTLNVRASEQPTPQDGLIVSQSHIVGEESTASRAAIVDPALAPEARPCKSVDTMQDHKSGLVCSLTYVGAQPVFVNYDQAAESTMGTGKVSQPQHSQHNKLPETSPREIPTTILTPARSQSPNTQAMLYHAHEAFFAPSPSPQPPEQSRPRTPVMQSYISASQPETGTRRPALQELSQQPLPATQVLMESWSPWSEYKKPKARNVRLTNATIKQPNSKSATAADKANRRRSGPLRFSTSLANSPMASGKLVFPTRKPRATDNNEDNSGTQKGDASPKKDTLDTCMFCVSDEKSGVQKSLFREESQLSQTIEDLEATVLNASVIDG